MGFFGKLFGGDSNGKAPRQDEGIEVKGLPYSLVAVPGEGALRRWKELQAAGQSEGFTPVILGDMEDMRQLWDVGDTITETPEALAERAVALDVRQWLAERPDSEPAEFEVEEGEWPDEEMEDCGFRVIADDDGEKFKETVYIAKIPTREAWQVPLYLRIGDWNECPPPEVHAAIARYWQEKYGAVLVCARYDTLEYHVARPPVDRQAAQALAREQFIYCTDIVHQGTETLNGLAATLLQGEKWYFWWD